LACKTKQGATAIVNFDNLGIAVSFIDEEITDV
jgi:hypothetical protein